MMMINFHLLLRPLNQRRRKSWAYEHDEGVWSTPTLYEPSTTWRVLDIFKACPIITSRTVPTVIAKTGWAPKSVWTVWRKRKYLACTEHRSKILRSSNSWPTQHPNYTNIFSSSTGITRGGMTTNTRVLARSVSRWRTATLLLTHTDFRWRTATQLLTSTDCRWRSATQLLTKWRTANQLLTSTDCRWRSATQLMTRTDCMWQSATHLRVSVSWRVPTHGLNIQKYRLVRFMVQCWRSANGACQWVDAEVTIRVAGVYGVRNRTSGPWRKKESSFCHYGKPRVSLRNIGFT